MDTPLFPEKIPAPYELPDGFRSIAMPTVYLSFGSMCSAYTRILQRIINLLENLPYKYIIRSVLL